MTGATIAQAVPIAVSPILTRLYSPKEFGILTVFASLTAIFGSIASMRYELAVMLPEDEEDAINIGALGIVVAGAISIALFVLVCIFCGPISHLLSNEKVSSDQIAPWLFLVPFSVFLVGLFNVLNYVNNRRKHYRDIATAGVHKSLTLATTQISLGLLSVGAGGLITGQFFGLIANTLRLSRTTLRIPNLRSIINWKSMRRTGKRYRDFPFFSAPAILANTSSVNATNILISTFFSHATLGQYSMTQRMLGLPSQLIGRSISQVFFQQATKEKNETGVAIVTFDKTVKKLLLITVPTFLVMFFVVEEVFAFVFSEKWRLAGVYTRILIPLFAIRFVVAAVSNTNNVFEKQKLALAWQIGLLVLSLGSVAVAWSLEFSFERFLAVYCVLASLHYCLLYLLLRSVAQGRL